MSPEETAELVEIHVLRFPVALWQQSQEHVDALMREFALIASEASRGDDPHVPRRLLDLIESLNAQFSGFTTEQEAAMEAAADAGVPEIDLVYRVPRDAGPASVELGRMLEEADAYCRTGKHLLTLATPPEQIRFRNWYLAQFIGQPEGAAPVAWPDWQG